MSYNIFLMQNKKIILYSIFSCLVLSNCEKVHKGYKFYDNDKEKMEKMVEDHSTIQEIINEFGSPSFVNSPINDMICYIDAEGKKVAFNRFYSPTYHFMCIVFDEEKKAKELKKQSLTKIKKSKMVKFDTNFQKPL